MRSVHAVVGKKYNQCHKKQLLSIEQLGVERIERLYNDLQKNQYKGTNL